MLNGCWENRKNFRGLLFSAAPCRESGRALWAPL